MKKYIFSVLDDFDSKIQTITISANNDNEAKTKFLKSKQYVAGVYTNSHGKNILVENPFVIEMRNIHEKAYKFFDNYSYHREMAKKHKDIAKENSMKHRYGIYLTQAMKKKGWYLSKKEKKSIWAKVKKEFNICKKELK